MYLCVLDYEATCWKEGSAEAKKYGKEVMEIIEMPSVLYKLKDGKLEFIGEFHKYVKPTIVPKLSTFCSDELTGIKQETVDKADTFDVVYKEHFKWLSEIVGTEELVFVTCGHWDLATQLPRELRNKKLKKFSIYKHYINIKDEFEYFYKRKAGDMPTMLKSLKLTLDGHHHSGIDDSRNIAKILIKIVNDGHTNFQYNTLK
jgi:inhibitor of KinA sporulation pathway (predicted exonuclease)